MKDARTVSAATILLALTPGSALACAVCGLTGGGGSDSAYFAMSVMLSALPLGMIGGTVFWLYRKSAAHDAGPATGRDAAGTPVPREDSPHVPQHQDAVQLRPSGE